MYQFIAVYCAIFITLPFKMFVSLLSISFFNKKINFFDCRFVIFLFCLVYVVCLLYNVNNKLIRFSQLYLQPGSVHFWTKLSKNSGSSGGSKQQRIKAIFNHNIRVSVITSRSTQKNCWPWTFEGICLFKDIDKNQLLKTLREESSCCLPLVR